MNDRSSLLALAITLGTAACSSGSSDGADSAGTSAAALTGPAVDLIAIGTLEGTIGDLACETSAPLENGVAGNLLGGLGSGIAYAGGDEFVAVPDRGPNAQAYNSAVDDTSSFIARLQTIRLRLEPSAPSTDAAALPFSLTPRLIDTTLLWSKEPLVYGTGAAAGLPSGAPALNRRHHFYFTGRSDNFDAAQPSSDPSNARLDPESVRISNDGEHAYVSDEYGPYVYEIDRWSGRRVRTFTLPSELAVATPSSVGATEISGNVAGRVANKGMEGLAISPNGRTLFGAMQSPLIQDGGTSGGFTRIVTIDVATGATTEHAYELTNIGSASKPKYPTISEIVAVNDHQILVDERDGKGLGDDSTAAFKHIYLADLAGAADVSGLQGEASLASSAISKTLVADVVAILTAHGIAATDIPAKLEGMAFGKDVTVGGVRKHTLYLTNDNDFVGTVTDSNHPAGIDNPNRFFVFAIDPSVIPGFEKQRIRD